MLGMEAVAVALRQRLVNRGALLGGVAVCAAVLVAGCGGNGTGGSAGPATIPSISSSGSVSAVSTGSSVAQPSATAGTPGTTNPGSPSAAPAGPTTCHSADLTVGLAGGGGAAGTVYRSLQFTNKGAQPCTLQGFPGVSYTAGDDGHQVGSPAIREGDQGGTVTLNPGQVASAAVGFAQVDNFDPAECQKTLVRGIRVYPPGETNALFVPMSDQYGCAGNVSQYGAQLKVKPVQPGPGA
jgi:hypothetical protein